jgi:hypothetical protein
MRDTAPPQRGHFLGRVSIKFTRMIPCLRAPPNIVYRMGAPSLAMSSVARLSHEIGGGEEAIVQKIADSIPLAQAHSGVIDRSGPSCLKCASATFKQTAEQLRVDHDESTPAATTGAAAGTPLTYPSFEDQ